MVSKYALLGIRTTMWDGFLSFFLLLNSVLQRSRQSLVQIPRIVCLGELLRPNDLLGFILTYPLSKVGDERCALAVGNATVAGLDKKIKDLVADLYQYPLPAPHADRPGVLTSSDVRCEHSLLYTHRSLLSKSPVAPPISKLLSSARCTLPKHGSPSLTTSQPL